MKMRIFSSLTVASFTVAALFVVVPVKVQAQTSCQASTIKQTFPGGLVVERMCNNRLIGGMGSTTTAANANLSSFLTLFPTKGCRGSNDPAGQFPGGYRVTFDCTNSTGSGYRVSGVGTNVTQAGQNAFSFGQLYTALDDVACHVNNYNVTGFVGGYRVETNCIKSGLPAQAIVTGIGTTATDAGINARGFAELVASGKRCSLYGNVTGGAGYFQATFQCSTGQIFTGYGSTVTAAGEDALAIAQMP